MKRTISKITLQCFLLLSITISCTLAQNGTACYKPFKNIGKVARPVLGSVVCLNCGFINNITNTTDNSIDNFAQFSNLASLSANDGISVTDTVSTYPAGWFAGYVVDLGTATVLTANVLSAFQISTYNNGVLQESRTSGNGLAVATVAGISQRRIYLNFKTTLPFDEIRFTLTGVVNAISTVRVYYATAFDPDCGTLDNNNACGDQIAGSKTDVTFNGGTASALTTISNPEFITDGNKRTAATVTIPVGLLTSQPYVGVLDEQRVYPAGQKAGFVITYSSALTANVLNAFRIETYLFGVFQEQGTTAANLLSVSALGIGNDSRTISFITTKKFNEVRLVFAQVAGINIGSIGVNYAFEEPPTCTTCENIVGAGQPGVYAGTINTTRTTTNGFVCISNIFSQTPAVLTNSALVVDSDTSNYATYNFPLAGSGCGFDLSVKLGDTVHRKSFVGFVVEQTGGLATANLFSNITIATYRNNVLKSTSNASSLLNLGALSLLNAGKYKVGFVSDSAFDEVVIRFSTGGLSISGGGEFRTYYPFVIRDDDGDGTPDCKEICGMAGDDGIDTDGDGIPDACDVGLETPLNLRVLLQGSMINPPDSAKDLMRSDLNRLGFIPLQQPYSSTLSPRFAQVGGGAEAVIASVLNRSSILSNILVDWVLVEIRDSINPATIRKTVSALVARNGEIVDTLGGPLMVSLPAGHYYISVKHRNHLGVMTGTAMVTAGVVNSIDFSTLTPAQLYGNGAIARIQVSPGVYALWAGDVNGDGKVKYQGPNNDANPVLNAVLTASPNIGVFSYNYDNLLGYFRSDVDLSGKAKYQGPFNDVNTILTNILLFSPNQPAFNYNYDFLTEQLP